MKSSVRRRHPLFICVNWSNGNSTWEDVDIQVFASTAKYRFQIETDITDDDHDDDGDAFE